MGPDLLGRGRTHQVLLSGGPVVETQLPSQGFVFWPVGTGDSTTIVVDDEHVIQVDIHDMDLADDDDADVSAVVDRLVETLPQRDGKPYLSVFVLTHADLDHCRGFADLLEKVTIGEIWATPRLWREYDESDEPLPEEAEAFRQECERRVEATLKAVEAGVEASSGDRIRVVGYDTEHSKHSYSELPDSCLTYPGDAISVLDNENVESTFEAFVHAPFKDDCAAERNDTSLALQVTLKCGEESTGRALLLGDLAYATISKIFEYSVENDRVDRLKWDLLLAPHHCSKKVMYVNEDGSEVRKDDILNAFEEHANPGATIISSSREFPSSNSPGDNPPHVIARARYEEIVETGHFRCTAEYPSLEEPQPLVFGLSEAGLNLIETDELAEAERAVAGLDAKTALVGAGAGLILSFGISKFRRWNESRQQTKQPGLEQARQAVSSARDDESVPQQMTGFGSAC